MNEKKWDIEKLDSGGRSSLKREAGVMMGNDYQALEAFYRAVSYVPRSREQESQWFACICMQCLWKADDHPRVLRIEELLGKLYHNPETSESIKHRVIALMDVPWSGDGYLLGKLTNLVRMMRGKDSMVMPDFEALADDLAAWNHPDRYVQRRWIRTICGSSKNDGNHGSENEKEEETNVD